MEGVKIIEVGNSKHWNQFVNLPWKIYAKDPNWVPPLLFEFKRQLNPSKNPFFRDAKANYWIAMKNGESVGRIAAIINNRHNEHYSDKVGFFGYFECIDDHGVANELFNIASDWLQTNGKQSMRGPVNLSTFYECGLLIEGFDSSPLVQMTYNPLYYIRLFDHVGFKKEIDLLAFEITESIYNNEKVMQKLQRLNDVVVHKEHLTFRTFNSRDFSNEVERMRILFNDYMSENWGFVPIDKEEFGFMAESLKQILIKDMAIFAEVDGQPVGFSIALPDINQVFKRLNGKLFPIGIFKYLYYKNKVSALRVILMGVNKPYRKKGLEAVFYYHTIKEAQKRNFNRAELSWISEKNQPMIRALVNMNAELYKRYRIFEKEI
ncbi:MAG: hypothetical protein JKY09_05540 [Crocinitomicaceae bacterium]|nr:hypothetical protein [Crocinitomicaceae bacterium]